MNDSNDILTLLGLKSANISNYFVTTDGEKTLIQIELKKVRQVCPHCGSLSTEIKDYYVRRINNSIVKHNLMTVEIRQRRYKCKDCHKTFNQPIDFMEKYATISNAAKRSILDDLKEPITLSSIAKNYDVSPTTVMTIFDKGVLPQLRGKLPSALCIDEFCFGYREGYGKYPAVLSDYFTGKIIDIVPSRWKDILVEYLSKIPLHEIRNVKFFMSDMNDTYRYIKRRFFRDAVHIIDMFHITKQFTEAVQIIRKRIMNKAKDDGDNSKEYRYLKKNYKLFLMHRDELIKRSKVDSKNGVVYDLLIEVNAALRKYDDLNKIYQIKEDFYEKTKKPLSWKDADNLMNFFINKLESSNHDVLMPIARTFTKWKYEITCTLARNTYGIRLSNAVAEGNNNYIQTLINMSYGLLDFERTRKRILYISRNKKTRRN